MSPSNSSAQQGRKEAPPVGIFCFSLRLLPLRRWDFAFNGEGNAVGAWHTKAGGIASYLPACEHNVGGVGDQPSREPTFRAWQVCRICEDSQIG